MSWIKNGMKGFLLKHNWWFYFVLSFAIILLIVTKGTLGIRKEKTDL